MNENNDQALSTGEGESAVDELALLKERAKQMGIPFSNNISLETLRKRISDKMEGKDVPEVNPLTGDAEIAAITSAPVKLDAKQNALALRKMIPYGEQTDEGFHIPYCLFRLLQSKRFLHIRTVKDRVTGVERQDKQWVKEFSLDVLPDLTKEELARLAAAQAAAGL